MSDPRRLRADSGSPEALLLRSSPALEPPPDAEDAVWRKLEALTAAGAAAGASAIAAHAAGTATPQAATKALALALIKWGAVVVAVGVPAAGAAHWVMHRAPPAEAAVAPGPSLAQPDDRAEHAAASPDPDPTAAPVDRATPRVAARRHPAGKPEPSAGDAPSALTTESRDLAVARAAFARGDARGALDDVTRLAQQFPHGRLIQERETLAIDCLAALGDRRAAQARAAAFLERFPDSPYASHVRPIAGP